MKTWGGNDSGDVTIQCCRYTALYAMQVSMYPTDAIFALKALVETCRDG